MLVVPVFKKGEFPFARKECPPRCKKGTRCERKSKKNKNKIRKCNKKTKSNKMPSPVPKYVDLKSYFESTRSKY
jgi:hypothetical protein